MDLPENKRIIPQDITEEMTSSYLDYAMSVIVSRALPDARDGLKPVQRRILFAMDEMGLSPQAKQVKSARVVGEVLGKYHPHGDQAVYDTLVRMAQTFSLRYPMIVGQGNFGSVDGDTAAAMRYTEVKLAQPARALLDDIHKDTVDFVPNYDGTREEPRVLPSSIPHLLMNGSIGIAVGMSTAIPPHNLSELIEACMALIQKPSLSHEELCSLVRGPDFPTGGIIYHANDLVAAYAQGKGPVFVRGKAEIGQGERKGARIVISEIPYEVRKSAILEQIADLVRDKKIEGVRDVRDESDKEGLRVVVDLRQDAVPQVVLAALFKYTDLQRTYHMNLLALEQGLRPKLYSLKELLLEFLEFRKETIRRRSLFELGRAKDRLHILEGLSRALAHIDEVIKTIRSSQNRDDAHARLKTRFRFSDKQTDAILAMPLASLARLEREKILNEEKEKKVLIAKLEEILKNPKVLLAVLKEELAQMKERFGDARKTEVRGEALSEIKTEDLVPDAPAVIAVTTDGYIKRLPPSLFRVQQRGGRGVSGIELRESEGLAHVLVARTHDWILLFSDRGKAYRVRAHEIPESSRTSRGRALANVVSIAANEEVRAIVAAADNAQGYLAMITRKGIGKRVALDQLSNVRRNGTNAISLSQDDALVSAVLTHGSDDLLLLTYYGQALRFPEQQLRAMGRQAAGIRLIKLKKEDGMASVIILPEKDADTMNVVLVGEKGFGKLVAVRSFRKQRRGGMGVRAMPYSSQSGPLVAAAGVVQGAQEVFAVSKKGLVLRLPLGSIRTLSRTARGVRLMKLEAHDAIAAVRIL